MCEQADPYDSGFEDDLALLTGEKPTRREAVFPEGWRCPLCRTIYNPHVVMCSRCSSRSGPQAVPPPWNPPPNPPPNPPSYIQARGGSWNAM